MGQADRYYLQRVMQRALHGALRKTSQFVLTGAPLTPAVLQHLAPRDWRLLWGPLAAKLGFGSGDYADATNKIESWASNLVADGIISGWRSAQRKGTMLCPDLELFEAELRSGLTGNRVMDPRTQQPKKAPIPTLANTLP